jgi:hypothetical protein
MSGWYGCMQLAIAKELVYCLDCAQDRRSLAPHEIAWRGKTKVCSLGLASLQRMITRQRARITFLAEGDANTKFFHLLACPRSRKNHIEHLRVHDVEFVQEEEKAEASPGAALENVVHFQGLLAPKPPLKVLLWGRVTPTSTPKNSFQGLIFSTILTLIYTEI